MRNLKQAIIRFWQDEEGLGTLEILLILAVIVIVAVAFRKWIFQWVEGLFNKADKEINVHTGDDTGNIMPKGK
ncbi:Flp pilus assembly protein, pilin Flp [Chlamydia abortus]|jgi:Flp pilus assembly pilin Flp|uniref:Flp1 family type IVb pilin n=1 Tax=unclassified Paenibacillus TaxID=185978 RepID=UPI000A27B5D9|nr:MULTISPECIES: Flp1 family type IVb pilin [Paenibacillaceae]SHE14038.1 Flp pilus assembly protein, pilin Flp [Chlamydia abortus]